MSNRLQQCFETLKAQNKRAFIPFLTAGYPDSKTSLALLHAMVDCHADIVEWGIPFSDPAADGPIIQIANEVALHNGCSVTSVLAMVREFRKDNNRTPLILMGYANPLYHYGMKRFAKDAQTAGVDGVIVVDIPMEEDADTAPLRANLDVIRLVAPTTHEARIKQMMTNASGFVYYISVAATTGTKSIPLSSLKHHIGMIKKHTSLPIAVGFGINSTDSARAAASCADGVVVGSHFLQILHEAREQQCDSLARLAASAQKLADAIHGVA